MVAMGRVGKMALRIGIITVRDNRYHPNRRLLEAARMAGHLATLIHPYRLWPTTEAGRLGLTGRRLTNLPQVVLPRQGAQIGDACLALIRQFQCNGIPLVNDADAVAIARNKFLTQQVLTAAGLPCPDTIFVNQSEGLFHAVDRLNGFPVVVKPVSQRQGNGVLLIRNLDDAHKRALPVLDRRWGLLVQRYLPPDKRRDIRALVIDGLLFCAATLVPSGNDFRANFHLGANLQATTLGEEMAQIAVGATAAVGCDVAGVDLMIDHQEQPHIVEVNYSPGFRGMEAATGLDIASRIIDLAITRYHQFKESTDTGNETD